MVDFKDLRKKLEEYEAENDSDLDSEESSSDLIMGFIPPIPGKKKELQDTSVSVPLSVGSGILLALGFDWVRGKGENPQIFEGVWQSLGVFTGALLFGYGFGKLNRGTVAHAEAEYYENIIKDAEEEVKSAEEDKKAEQGARNDAALNLLTNPDAFTPSPIGSGISVFGEYGSAIGQNMLSYRY